MRWIDAVRKWNDEHNKGLWCMPRKGTKEHAQVMAILNAGKLKAAEPAAAAPKMDAPKKFQFRKPAEKARLAEIGKKVSDISKKERVKKFLAKLVAARRAAKTEEKKKRLDTLMEALMGMKVSKMDEKPASPLSPIAAAKTPLPKSEPASPKAAKKVSKEVMYDYLGHMLYRRLDSGSKLEEKATEIKHYEDGRPMFYIHISPEDFDKNVSGYRPGDENEEHPMGRHYSYKMIHDVLGDIDFKYDSEKIHTSTMMALDTGLHFSVYNEYKVRNFTLSDASDVIERNFTRRVMALGASKMDEKPASPKAEDAGKVKTFPFSLTEKQEKYLMTKHFKYTSPDDDSLAILDKDKPIAESDIRLFQYLLGKKLTEKQLQDLLPHKRNYFYYSPKKHSIDVWSESRM